MVCLPLQLQWAQALACASQPSSSIPENNQAL